MFHFKVKGLKVYQVIIMTWRANTCIVVKYLIHCTKHELKLKAERASEFCQHEMGPTQPRSAHVHEIF